jgi:hypothetical protein
LITGKEACLWSTNKEVLIYLILVFCLFSASQQSVQDTLLGTVYFDTTGKALTPESDIILRDIADTLIAKPNLMINLYGCANTAGLQTANITLAQEMANQVRIYLTSKLHIAGDRIQTFGSGSEDRIALNKPEKYKMDKPRVDIVIRQPDAVLTWFENDVKVQPPALRPHWLNPVPNYFLYSGYRIITGKKSRAHIFYPNSMILKMDEDAMVIINGMNLPQKENSFVDNIELQGGGLKALLEDAAGPGDSITELSVTVNEQKNKNHAASIDEKIEDLLVAYQSNPESPTASQESVIDNNENMDIDKDTFARTPDGLEIGVIIGDPTGISIKKWLAGKHSIDFEIGWSFPGERIHIAVDYLSYFPEWTKKHNLYPHLSVGSRLKMKAEQGNEQFILGIRFGGGVEYLCGQFGLYAELYPVVDIVPETKPGLEGGVGIRYYFRS